MPKHAELDGDGAACAPKAGLPPMAVAIIVRVTYTSFRSPATAATGLNPGPSVVYANRLYNMWESFEELAIAMEQKH